MKFLSSSILFFASSLFLGSNAFDGFVDDGTMGMNMGLDPVVLMQLMGAVSSCGIDILSTGMALSASSSDPTNMDFEAMSKILGNLVAPVDNECSVEDEQTFRDALSDFKTCSGVDLETMMETWPSASIGELLSCASSNLKNLQAFLPYLGSDEPFQIPKLEFSEQCTKNSYGPNPVGDFGRLIWKHPGVVCGCLSSFSKAAPDCTIEEWPIPLVGNWMRKSSCLIDATVCPMLEKICAAELNVLDQCLPPMDVSSDKYDCDAVQNSCIQQPLDSGFDVGMPTMPSLLNFPQEMTGAPMPDTCQSVAGHAEFKSKNLLFRYNQHLNECVTKWEGWSDDYVSEPVTTTTLLIAAASNGGKTVVKQSMGGFIGGMIVASVLFAGVAFYLYKAKGGVLPSATGYNSMPSNGFEMN